MPNIQRVVRIDVATNQVAGSAPVRGCGGIAVDGDVIWAAQAECAHELTRIDAATSAVVARIRLGSPGGAITVGLGSVWVATNDGRLIRTDPATNAVVGVSRLGTRLAGVEIGGGSVWSVSPPDNSVIRLRPAG